MAFGVKGPLRISDRIETGNVAAFKSKNQQDRFWALDFDKRQKIATKIYFACLILYKWFNSISIFSVIDHMVSGLLSFGLIIVHWVFYIGFRYL